MNPVEQLEQEVRNNKKALETIWIFKRSRAYEYKKLVPMSGLTTFSGLVALLFNSPMAPGLYRN